MSDEGTTWHYRTCVERTKDGPVFTVREVYHGPRGRDDKLSWTAEPCHPQGDTWMEMFDDLSIMGRGAATFPILDITDEKAPVWVDRKGEPVDHVGA